MALQPRFAANRLHMPSFAPESTKVAFGRAHVFEKTSTILSYTPGSLSATYAIWYCTGGALGIQIGVSWDRERIPGTNHFSTGATTMGKGGVCSNRTMRARTRASVLSFCFRRAVMVEMSRYTTIVHAASKQAETIATTFERPTTTIGRAPRIQMSLNVAFILQQVKRVDFVYIEACVCILRVCERASVCACVYKRVDVTGYTIPSNSHKPRQLRIN